MFETSIVAQTGTNRPWTVIAGFSGQVVGVGVLVLVPLIYTEQLPKFDFNSLHVLPPITRLAPEPPPLEKLVRQTRTVTSARRSVFQWHGAARPLSELSKDPELPTIDVNLPTVPVPYLGPASPIGINQSLVTLPPPPSKPPVVHRDQPATPEKVIQVEVGGKVQDAKIIRRVIPTYPRIAVQAGISGKVHLVGMISRDGTIRDLRVISGHPLLIKAAVDAVSQWTYSPTLLNGKAVEVIAPIEVNFTLSR